MVRRIGAVACNRRHHLVQRRVRQGWCHRAYHTAERHFPDVVVGVVHSSDNQPSVEIENRRRRARQRSDRFIGTHSHDSVAANPQWTMRRRLA